MSTIQSSGATSEARDVRGSERKELRKSNAVTGSSFSTFPSPGKQSVTIPRPTTNPDYVPPERTSSLSFKAPATGRKPAKTPDPTTSSRSYFSALDYFSFPVKFIASKFSSAPPEPEKPQRKFKIDSPKRKDSVNAKVPQKAKPVHKEAKPSGSTLSANSGALKHAEIVAPAGDSGALKPSENESPQGAPTPPVKAASRSYVSVHTQKAMPPFSWKPPERKNKLLAPIAPESRLISANAINISPSNKLSYKVTSKYKEENAAQLKKDPRKIHKHSNKKHTSLTSSKSPHRDSKATQLFEKQEESNFPTFLRHAFPPSYTVKTVSAPDIPDRSNSASTDALNADATTLVSSPLKTEQEAHQDDPDEPKDRVNNLPMVPKPVLNDPFEEDPVLCNPGPTFLGPPTILKSNKRSNSMVSNSTPGWKHKLQVRVPKKDTKKNIKEPTSVGSSSSLQSYLRQEPLTIEEECTKPTFLDEILPQTPPETKTNKRRKSLTMGKNAGQTILCEKTEATDDLMTDTPDTITESAGAGAASLETTSTSVGATETAITITGADDEIKGDQNAAQTLTLDEESEMDGQSLPEGVRHPFNFKKKAASKKLLSLSKRQLDAKKSPQPHKKMPSYANPLIATERPTFLKSPPTKETEIDLNTVPPPETPSLEMASAATVPSYNKMTPPLKLPSQTKEASSSKTSSRAEMSSHKKTSSHVRTTSPKKMSSSTKVSSAKKTPSHTRMSSPMKTSSRTTVSSPKKTSPHTKTSSPKSSSNPSSYRYVPPFFDTDTPTFLMPTFIPSETPMDLKMTPTYKTLQYPKVASPAQTPQYPKKASPARTPSHTKTVKKAHKKKKASPVKTPPSSNTGYPANVPYYPVSKVPSPPVTPSNVRSKSVDKVPHHPRKSSPAKTPSQTKTESVGEVPHPPMTSKPTKTRSFTKTESVNKVPYYPRTTSPSKKPSHTKIKHRKKSSHKKKRSASAKPPEIPIIKYPTFLPFHPDSVSPTLLPSFLGSPAGTPSDMQVEFPMTTADQEQTEPTVSSLAKTQMESFSKMPFIAQTKPSTTEPVSSHIEYTTEPANSAHTNSSISTSCYTEMEVNTKESAYPQMDYQETNKPQMDYPIEAPSNTESELPAKTPSRKPIETPTVLPASIPKALPVVPPKPATDKVMPKDHPQQELIKPQLAVISPGDKLQEMLREKKQESKKSTDVTPVSSLVEHDIADVLRNYGGDPYYFVSAATMMGELP